MVNLSGGAEDVSAPFPEDSQNNDDAKANDEQQRSAKAPYTIPGVLHYIQHEWSRFEMERAQWEMERAELQARISFLQGERKGQENLKLDLVRRIKMLEYSLKQERLKNYRLTHAGSEPDPEIMSEERELDQQTPLDVDSVTTQPNSNLSWRQGRQLLRQYLQEIGYSETILDVRSFRVRSLLGLAGQEGNAGDGSVPRSVAEKVAMESEQSIMATMEFLQPGAGKQKGLEDAGEEAYDSDSDDEPTILEYKGKGQAKAKRKAKDDLGAEEVAALGEFDFLAGDAAQQAVQQQQPKTPKDQWDIDQQALDRMKDLYRMEAQTKKAKAEGDGSKQTATAEGEVGRMLAMLGGDNLAKIESEPKATDQVDAMQGMFMGEGAVDIDAALGLVSQDERDDIADEFGLGEEDGALPKKWSLRYTLRNHFDAIRAMQFHPVEPLLCTASEDGTVKLWNLAKSSDDSKTTISDLEPVYTFRGHRGAVLSLFMSPTGDMCYTGGLDGTVRCWMLPSPNIDIYDKFDAKVLVETLQGHADSVWSVAFHTSDNRLISASADSTLKLWEPGSPDPLLKTYGPSQPGMIPTCVDFVSTEPQQVAVAYAPGSASVLDLETGRTVLQFDCSDEGNASRVTCVASHPTMPVTITGGEDRRIRYFDNNSGELIQGTVAHVESISSLAIDPNGLYLLSGSADGSLRLWNMEKRVCLQEIAAHRKKYDESVLSVAFHPSRPLIGSAGADSLAKIYA